MAQQQRLPSQTDLHAADQMSAGTASGAVADDTSTPSQPRVTSPARDAWIRFRKNWAAVISMTVVVVLVVMAMFAPFMHTANPLNQDYAALHQGPSWQHWFGTDGVGRDNYSRSVFGLRVLLFVGIVGTFITVILGSLIGVVAGYAGGWIDTLLSRFTDLIFAFPVFVLALICAALFGNALDSYIGGGGGTIIVLTIIFAAVGWPSLMRFVRSLALGLREQQFIEAARTSGTSHWKIITRHLLPNMWGLILVQASFIAIAFISTEAVLSLLGLGVKPPDPDIGVMLDAGLAYMDLNYWETLVPTCILTVIILAFTFLGDGIRDAVDPRMNS